MSRVFALRPGAKTTAATLPGRRGLGTTPSGQLRRGYDNHDWGRVLRSEYRQWKPAATIAEPVTGRWAPGMLLPY